MTSKLGEKPVPAVAADANVLLSAVLGHAALKVFTLTDVSVLTTRSVLQEVREYLPLVAKQYDILLQALEGQLRLLAVRECEPDEYAPQLEAAKRAIARRDPDDVDLLALALAFGVPVWSNDNDFKDAGVEWYTRRGCFGAWESSGGERCFTSVASPATAKVRAKSSAQGR